MAEYTFDAQRECPSCQAAFTTAEQKSEYDPVVVVVCPGCGELLWRPGYDESSRLFPFDPDASDGL